MLNSLCHTHRSSKTMAASSAPQASSWRALSSAAIALSLWLALTLQLQLELAHAHAHAHQLAPIQRTPHFTQGQHHHLLEQVRRSSEEPEVARYDESEAQQLRQLHQVVDTVAHLLGEEEEERRKQQAPSEDFQSSASEPQAQLALPPTPSKQDFQSTRVEGLQQQQQQQPELMSESALRQAIEELERVQQQERQFEQQARRAPPAKQSALEGLIDELGDELLGDQLAAASQEAERLVQQRPDEKKSDASFVSASQRSLVMGQLEAAPESPAAELNSALTNDFYNFHAESIGASAASPASSTPVVEPTPADKKQSSSSKAEPQADLDSAAQTRNSQRQELPDFSQPAPSDAPQGRHFRSPTESPSSAQAFSNFGAPDNFWRPTQGGPLDDLSQQYGRASSLPPLPASRFQSLASPAPFLQPQAGQTLGGQQQARPGHTHFTGHSFVDQQPSVSAGANLNLRPAQAAQQFTSTAPPIISVIGSDSAASNSVSWNPPAGHSPPPTGGFNSPFSTLAPSAGAFSNSPLFRDAFGPPNSEQQANANANQFRPSAGQQFNNQQFDSSTPEARAFPSSTEPTSSTSTSSPTSTSTAASTTGVWSPFVSEAPRERDAADSHQRSTVRSFPASTGNQRASQFASTSGDTEFATTVASTPAGPSGRAQFATPFPPAATSTEFPFVSSTGRLLGAPAAPTTTPTSLDGAPANATAPKKDDMVIYYYYYYDDNKNATVVAKNISAAAGAHINGASLSTDPNLDSDGGLEDTPYMDDPAPAAGSRQPQPVSSQRPPLPPASSTTSTTTTTTSTTTMASTALPASTSTTTQASNLQFSNNFNARNRAQSRRVSVRPDESATADDEPGDAAELERAQNDQQRPPPVDTRRANFAPPGEQLFASSPATPISPSTTARAPPGRAVVAGAVASSTRGGPTEGARPQPSRQQPVQSAPQSAQSSRGSLSNASRYGTSTSNQFLDPYGLEPSDTPQRPVSSGSPPAAAQSPHKKRPASLDSLLASTGALPAAPLPANELPPTRGAAVATTSSQSARQVGQFSAQRQQAPSQRPAQPTAARTQAPPARQFFPESSGPVASPPPPPPPAPARSPIPVSPPSRVSQPPSSTQQPIESLPSSRGPSSPSPLDIARRPLATQSPANGRPISSEGNTGNGFTRAPPVSQSSAANFASTLATVGQRLSSAQPRPPTVSSTTAASLSSQAPTESPGRQFSPAASLGAQSPAGSSLGATLISSSQPPPPPQPSTSTTTTSTSTTSTTTTSTTTTSTTTTTPAPTTQASDSAASTESADSLASSTRRKFGNRNNRFQTRLTAVRASTTTTSTSTPAPQVFGSSSSTTRRPASSSTTRKSSKQLFAGRRRLPSATSTSSSAAPAETSVSPTTPDETATNSVSASRVRFGNNFTARGRTPTSSTTSAPAPAEVASAGSKPASLFATQRATFKPRPALSRSSARPATSTSEAAASEAPVEPSDSSVASETPPAESTSAASSSSGSSSTQSTSAGAETQTESAPTDSQPESTSAQTESGSSSTSTAASATSTTSTSTTAKPKRPLFASRQRSSSLFGNRRANSTSS